MRELWEWRKEGLGNFVGFQAMGFGKTSVVSFWLITLVFGGQVYGRSTRYKI